MFDGVDQPTDDKILECVSDFIWFGNYSIYYIKMAWKNVYLYQYYKIK